MSDDDGLGKVAYLATKEGREHRLYLALIAAGLAFLVTLTSMMGLRGCTTPIDCGKACGPAGMLRMSATECFCQGQPMVVYVKGDAG
jgi:hypothetical protein